MIGIGMPINQSKRPRPKAVSSDSLVAQANVASKFKFPFSPAIGLPRSIELWSKVAEDCTLSDQWSWRTRLGEQTKEQSSSNRPTRLSSAIFICRVTLSAADTPDTQR